MPFNLRTGRVTRYTIWPVGTGGPGLPRTTSRHVEFKPTCDNQRESTRLRKSKLTIRRNNEVGRIAFSALCDKRGSVGVYLNHATVEV
jgi:hypothetical protein